MPALPSNLTNFQHGLCTLEVQGTGFTSRPLWKHLLKWGRRVTLTSEEKALHPLFGGSSSDKKRSEGLLAGSFVHSYLVAFILRIFFFSFCISHFFITVKPMSSPLYRSMTSMAWGNKHEKNKHTTQRDLNRLKATQPSAGSWPSSSSWLPARLRRQGAKIVPQTN